MKYLRFILVYVIISYQIWSGETLFVPEELPTLIGFVYNAMPPIAKGTDSRVGLGFRLGQNADFQMLFELGPQRETQTLAPIRGYESRKRHIPMSAYYGSNKNHFRPSMHQQPGAAPQPFLVRHSGTPDGWLSAWRNTLNSRHLTFQNNAEDHENNYQFQQQQQQIQQQQQQEQQTPMQSYQPNHIQSMLPKYQNKLSYKTIQHLRQLYKEQPT